MLDPLASVVEPEAKNVTYVARIEVPAASADSLAAALEAAQAPDAMAVTLFDRGGGLVEVSAHYAEEPARDQLIDLFRGIANSDMLAALNIERLTPQDWVASAEALRVPVRAGRFLVHGHHHRGKVPRTRTTLEIDAGLAFGTAHHATTHGCLIALDRLIKRLRPRCMLDIGTGSGILAIAAAKASNMTVLASDIDPIATATAAENARKNGVAARVHTVRAEGLSHQVLRRASVDLLFANLLLRPLLDLAPTVAGALRPGGICVLSGLLDVQAPKVEARFRSFGFRLDSRILLDGWVTLLLRRGSTRKGSR